MAERGGCLPDLDHYYRERLNELSDRRKE